MKRKMFFKIAIAGLLLSGIVSAQKVGTSSLQFLKVMPTARATAMADAFVALAGGADAVFWNPAGISSAKQLEIASTMTLWIFDSRQTTLSTALPLGDEYGTVALQLQYVDYGTIKETSVGQLGWVGAGQSARYLGYTGQTFSPYAYVAGISYAKSLTDKFSTGVTAKYVNESLYGSSSFNVFFPSDSTWRKKKTYAEVLLFDFGMQYNTGFRSIVIGVSVQNFGSQVRFADEGFPAPLAFRLGSSANLIGTDGLLQTDDINRLTIAYDIFQPNDYAQQMHFGLEYSFGNIVALRGGYKMNYDTERFTFGGGVKTSLQHYDIAFDYSYAGMGQYLSNVHRISLGIVVP